MIAKYSRTLNKFKKLAALLSVQQETRIKICSCRTTINTRTEKIWLPLSTLNIWKGRTSKAPILLRLRNRLSFHTKKTPLTFKQLTRRWNRIYTLINSAFLLDLIMVGLTTTELQDSRKNHRANLLLPIILTEQKIYREYMKTQWATQT